MYFVTSLGHAGFCVETDKTIVIMDPWLSPTGAFDSAWFQLPRNHHLAAYVQEKMQDTQKERFLYISHEHKDHFDIAFLNSLSCRDFTLILPRFRRKELQNMLASYRCNGIVTCADKEEVPIPSGCITLYLNDTELNRDSAILVKANGYSFLNMNDCKIHDRLVQIVLQQGTIDVFAAQFSGAIWHPTCYDYPRKVYENIARKKMRSKFEAVARALEIVKPRVYLASAGPACFLDPQLFHLNFEKVNIYPRAPKFFAFLDGRLKDRSIAYYEPMPGDVLDVEAGSFVYLAKERLTDDNFESYVTAYAGLYEGYFKDRQLRYSQETHERIWERLRLALEQKLKPFTLHHRIRVPLYFCLSDVQHQMIRIDFPNKHVEYVNKVADTNFYSIASPSWEVARVLDETLTWEDFMLTFRMRLNRKPDIYQSMITGFLTMEPEDMNFFCSRVLNAEMQQERTVIEADGCRYSINRFCPHQGADLNQAWIEKGKLVTCARHRWQFDLTQNGNCMTNDSSIHAFLIEED